MPHRRAIPWPLPALPLVPAFLALAACGAGHSEGGQRQEGPASPFGYEFAMHEGEAREPFGSSAPRQ
jgi:hypothetical protein